ncbi:unnamed protein product [Durusdinium trenchii]|uniref:Uncharacterized protein n=1 Tax=Durusdinium trenchii TaxID=1381693 RepID=A0ABP0QC14_9DINO
MPSLRARWRFRIVSALAIFPVASISACILFAGVQKQVRKVDVHCEARRVVRCPSCGQAQRADCDGNGRLLGTMAQVADWSPIKAYSVCPRFRGRYQRKGQKFDSLFDGDVDGKERDRMLEVPATWRSLTKIRIRELPDINSQATGDVVGPYESFIVDDVIRKDGQHFLKLAGKSGWVFDRGVVGSWSGKPICERLND